MLVEERFTHLQGNYRPSKLPPVLVLTDITCYVDLPLPLQPLLSGMSTNYCICLKHYTQLIENQYQITLGATKDLAGSPYTEVFVYSCYVSTRQLVAMILQLRSE